MPEGDNLARIGDVLRRILVDQTVTVGRGRPGGADLRRVVGQRVAAVETRGKHLLFSFDGGLTLHTHLGLNGTWHRYRPGEPWRRAVSRAGAVLETANAVAVCFDPMTIELIETRALAIHPVLSRLGPDASASDFDAATALRRLRDPARGTMAIGDVLLDQDVLAGVGNVIRSEVCFIERVDPFTAVQDLDDATLERLIQRSSTILRANRGGGGRVTTAPGTPGSLYVYGRTGRPCRRCGAPIASRISSGGRRAYWCPSCQRPAAERSARLGAGRQAGGQDGA